MPGMDSSEIPGTLQRLIPGYELVRELGRGGMGTVYKARQIALDRWVAIKFLREDLTTDPDYVVRFLREARIAGKLRHENIVSCLDCGKAKGRYFLVMEFVEGRELGKILAEQKSLPEPEALSIALGVAEGLRYAWERKVIHRDIKPRNIIIVSDGTPKICDLGLCRDVRQRPHLTQPGIILGTPEYASPEQCRGDSDIDTRSDPYSLGISLYRMLTGELPFRGDLGELLDKQNHEVPVAPRLRNSQISPGAEKLILDLLQKKREDRPSSPAKVIERIRNLVSNRVVSSSGTRRAVRAQRNQFGRKKDQPIEPSFWKSWSWGLGAAFLLLVCAAFLIANPSGNNPDNIQKRTRETKSGRKDKSYGRLQDAGADSKKERLRRMIRKGRGDLSEGKWREAMKNAEAVLRLWPDQKEALRIRRLAENGLWTEDLLKDVEREIEAREFKSALSSVEAVLRADPQSARALALKSAIRKTLYRKRMKRGRRAERGRLWNVARANYRLALAVSPNDADAKKALLCVSERWFREAMTTARRLRGAGDWMGAQKAVREALLAKLGNKEALQLYDEIRRHRQNASYTEAVSRAGIAEKKHDWVSAKSAWERALRARPGDSLADAALRRVKKAHFQSLLEQARGLRGQGEIGKALDACRNAISIELGNAAAVKLRKTLRILDGFAGFQKRALLGTASEAVLSLAVSPDGSLVVWGGKDRAIRLHRFRRHFGESAVSPQAGPIQALTVSPKGGLLASGSADGTISLVEYQKGGTSVRGMPLEAHPGGVLSLAFCPDGSRLASGGADGKVVVWNVSDRRRLLTFDSGRGSVHSLVYARDGSVLVGGCQEGLVLWKSDTGLRLKEVVSRKNAALRVVMEDHESFLAVGYADGRIRILDFAGWKERMILSGHKGGVRALAIDPSGHVVISGGADGIRFWDWESGSSFHEIPAHNGGTNCVGIRRGATGIISGGGDGTLRILGPPRQ